MAKCIILAGGGGHAAVIHDSAMLSKEEADIKVVWDTGAKVHPSLSQWVHVHSETDLAELLESGGFSVALCYLCFGDPLLRKTKADALCKATQKLSITVSYPNVVHPTAFLSSAAVIQQGNYFGPHSTTETGVVIGSFCIINAAAVVAHDSQLSDFVNVNPNASVCGNVKLMSGVTIGANAVVREKLCIAKNVTIGMGSVVTKDIVKGETMWYGVPAMLHDRKNEMP